MEGGGWRQEGGSRRRQEAGSRKEEVGRRRKEACDIQRLTSEKPDHCGSSSNGQETLS